MLSDESKLLTTFITHFARFAFNRLPMGLSDSSEYFKKKMTQIVESIDGVTCQTDEVLGQRQSTTKGDVRCFCD